MVKHTALIFLFIISLTSSCRKNTLGQDISANISPLQTVATNVIDTDDVSVGNCLLGISLPKIWAFDYVDGNFPCDTAGIMIKGFAAEADSVFYIMGGNPIAVAKYNGTRMIARRNLGLNLNGSYEALFLLRGDSLYFIDEQANVIYALHKGLQGALAAFSLPMEAEDSITVGEMGQDAFFLMTQKKSLQDDNPAKFTTWSFTYPNHIQKKVLGDGSCESLLPGYCKLRDVEVCFSYAGLIGDYRIFLNHTGYDVCFIAVADASGHILLRDSLRNLPPLGAVSGYEEHYGALASDNLNLVANDRVYLTGFNRETHKFSVLEYRIQERR